MQCTCFLQPPSFLVSSPHGGCYAVRVVSFTACTHGTQSIHGFGNGCKTTCLLRFLHKVSSLVGSMHVSNSMCTASSSASTTESFGKAPDRSAEWSENTMNGSFASHHKPGNEMLKNLAKTIGGPYSPYKSLKTKLDIGNSYVNSYIILIIYCFSTFPSFVPWRQW